MNTTSTPAAHDDHDSKIDALLNMVDTTTPAANAAPAKPADMGKRSALDELPAMWRKLIDEAGREAFAAELGKSGNTAAAVEAGKAAAGAKFDELVHAAGLDVEAVPAPLATAAAPALAVVPAAVEPTFVAAPAPRATLPAAVVEAPASAPDAARLVAVAPVALDPGVDEDEPVAVPPSRTARALAAASPLAVLPPVNPGADRERIDEGGRARSQANVDALRAAGFAPKEPIFDRGLLVNELGVANATKARADYDALPIVRDACSSLITKITAENRRIVEVDARALSMLADGRLVLPTGPIDLTEHGFSGMCERIGYGGAGYLSNKCPADLRALNVNAQRALLEGREDEARDEAAADGVPEEKLPAPKRIAARVRDRMPADKDPGGPEVFAFVSTGYPTFDADKIAEAFAAAMPENARGTVRYDSASTGARFEALFHSNVAPQDYVAGEVFQTGIRVRSNDSGDGSIVVRAIALQNLCRNLIILDRMGREIARIKHVGSVEALRKAFVAALEKAAKAIAPFLSAWGYACRENVAERIAKATGANLPSNEAELVRGIFAGVLASKRVRFPRISGKGRAAILDQLVAAWTWDASGAKLAHGGVTRAAVVNAFTRTAQEWISAVDPWATDSIELDASRLLWGENGHEPAPLPYVDPLKVLDIDETTPAPVGQLAIA